MPQLSSCPDYKYAARGAGVLLGGMIGVTITVLLVLLISPWFGFAAVVLLPVSALLMTRLLTQGNRI